VRIASRIKGEEITEKINTKCKVFYENLRGLQVTKYKYFTNP
jgi:hypothetical protein